MRCVRYCVCLGEGGGQLFSLGSSLPLSHFIVQYIESVSHSLFSSHSTLTLPHNNQAMFRKEDCGDLLAVRGADTPDTTGNDKTDKTEYIQEVLAPGERPRFPTGTMQVRVFVCVCLFVCST